MVSGRLEQPDLAERPLDDLDDDGGARDHRHVRGVHLGDLGTCALGHRSLRRRRDDPILGADDRPARDVLPGRRAGRLGDRRQRGGTLRCVDEGGFVGGDIVAKLPATTFGKRYVSTTSGGAPGIGTSLKVAVGLVSAAVSADSWPASAATGCPSSGMKAST